MNVGYVRLSKDDDKHNYVSIENQKLIIRQYAASNSLVIDRWYEDDGFSGYKFDRPAFKKMMEELDIDIDIVIAKDFSRIGRHNAKVLLLLEDFQERGKRLIIIDDNYDSLEPDDDIIGIKTWYNEKYVKDTSKKIRSALHARQKEGTLLNTVPFGYERNKIDKRIIEVLPEESEYVKMIFGLYLQGAGYRRISAELNESNIPTPSEMIRARVQAAGGTGRKRISLKWTDGMIRDMLKNDFYIGNYRMHKRARATLHGSDHRVPKEEQYLFEHHHEAIIDKLTYDLVQDIMEKRIINNYRGSKGQWDKTKISNAFGSCLFCKDCGSRLTPIIRKTNASIRKYYICTTYNTKGRQHCSKAHLIEEEDLLSDVITYIKLCRDTLCEMISTYDMESFETEKKTVEDKRLMIQAAIADMKKQLKAVFSQKIKDVAGNIENSAIISESYESLQADILAKIHGLELQLSELNDIKLDTKDVKAKMETALEVVDEIISKESLDRRDVETLIEKIVVDDNGMPEIELKYGLSGLVTYSPVAELNKRENDIILLAMNIIYEDERDFTSAKRLSIELTKRGYSKSYKSVLPYINILIKQGIIEPTENPRKPYSLVMTRAELNKCISDFHSSVPIRWDAGDGV